MEKYKINEKIGTGVLANVSQISPVENSNLKLVLKEIECLDVNSAKNALEELRVFHSLEHRFITKIKDSFVKWDKKLSTTSVCYVMDYFPKGDLMTYLNEKRLKKEAIPFETVKRWLGNVIEGVAYLHQLGFTHRNLKPSSLYMTNSSDRHLVIGDYGVITLMRDARTKTRILAGAFDYTAPEVFDTNSFDLKSDIWSLGCILLDICTTNIYDTKKLHSLLINVRHDDDLLDDILEDIYQVYESSSLVNILKLTLIKNSSQRLSIRAIINNEFIQECLELIDSELVIYLQPTEQDYNNKITPDQNLNTITDLIKDNINDEMYVQAAISRVCALLESQKFNLLTENSQYLLYKLMKVHSNNAKIQLSVFKIIEYGLISISNSKILNNNQQSDSYQDQLNFLNTNFVETFFYIFLKHDYSREIQFYGIKCLIHLSNFDNISIQLAKYDVIKYLLKILKNFQSDPIICGYVSKSIWCLCVNEEILKTLNNKKCLGYVKNIILTHRDNEFCVEMACKVVIAMCINERLVAEEEIEVDIISSILMALHYHLDSSRVVKSACLAFSSLIGLSENSAFRFVSVPTDDPKSNSDGIELLKEAYQRHKDECEVVEFICEVFKELANYDEMIEEMQSVKLNQNLLYEIAKRYRENARIFESCSLTIYKLEAKEKADGNILISTEN